MHPEKTELRKIMLEKRQALSDSSRRKQDKQLFDQLISLPSVQRLNTFLLTLSFNGECDTWTFARWIIEHKGFVILPQVEKESHTLKLCRVTDLEKQIQPGFKGIYEPNNHCIIEEFSVVEWALFPGLAFDAYGDRLGYGGGYFDQLLLQLPSTMYRMALGYRFQLLSQLPVEPHDQSIDTIILPNGPFQTYSLLTGL
jgi:5-formyltetrahydrofolate cyclo-ligase